MPAEYPNPLVPAKDQEAGPTPRLPCRGPWAEQAGSSGWCQLNRKEEALTVPADAGTNPIPDEFRKAAPAGHPHPPGSLSSLLLVEATCLVTLVITCFSGAPGGKMDDPRMASILLRCPRQSLGEDLTCDPI